MRLSLLIRLSLLTCQVASTNPYDYTAPGSQLPWQRSAKMVVLENLLRLWKSTLSLPTLTPGSGHRVLLFCQTRQMLDLVEAFVRHQVCGSEAPRHGNYG